MNFLYWIVRDLLITVWLPSLPDDLKVDFFRIDVVYLTTDFHNLFFGCLISAYFFF